MNARAPAPPSATGVRLWPAVLLALTAAAAGGCHVLTEIVLVIDTDMEVPADVAQFVVTVDGAAGMYGPLPVDLTVTENLPATLGLRPATEGSNAPLSVTVDAYSQDGPRVLMQTARTRFVPNERRMLRMVLSVSCLPVTCEADQTCQNGACVSSDLPADSLSVWSGIVPSRPQRLPPSPWWWADRCGRRAGTPPPPKGRRCTPGARTRRGSSARETPRTGGSAVP